MAKLSKNQRKVIGEAVRQMAANLGLLTPVKQEEHDSRIDHSQSEHDPKETPPKKLFDVISELLTVGVSGLLFALFCAGIINFFGQFPQIINFGAWGISALMIFGAGKMVLFHKRHWTVLLIALVGAALICLPAHNFVGVQVRKRALDTAQKQQVLENTTVTRKDVSDLITDIPAQIDRVKKGVDTLRDELFTNHIWQPPELPAGCRTAYFSFGDMTSKINLDQMTNESTFTPDWGLPDNEQGRSLKNSLPAVIFTNNRLCVRFTGWVAGTKTISNPFVLDEKLPLDLDRNYSANAFEVVDWDLCPVLQIIYERPNEVRVNGIFDPGKKGHRFPAMWVVFGNYHEIIQVQNALQQSNITHLFQTNVLFKYPSWKYPGQLANPEEAGINQTTTSFRLVAQKGAILGLDTNRPPFWLVQTDKNGEPIKSPACTFIWVRLTNLKNTYCMIDSYTVEIDHGGKWDVFAEMDLRQGQLCFPLDRLGLKEAAIIDCTNNTFNSALENRNMEPNATVEGWVLLKDPLLGDLRFRIIDTSGNEYIAHFARGKGPGKANGGTQIQDFEDWKTKRSAVKTAGMKDISNIRQVSYENRLSQ